MHLHPSLKFKALLFLCGQSPFSCLSLLFLNTLRSETGFTGQKKPGATASCFCLSPAQFLLLQVPERGKLIIHTVADVLLINRLSLFDNPQLLGTKSPTFCAEKANRVNVTFRLVLSPHLKLGVFANEEKYSRALVASGASILGLGLGKTWKET